MVSIFHGDDQVESRRAFLSLKARYDRDSVIEFSGDNLAPLVNALETPVLFSERKLLAVEASKQSQLASREHLAKLGEGSETTEVVFWLGELLSKDNPLLELARDKGWTVESFSLFNRREVYRLVDSIFLKDRQKAYFYLSQATLSHENILGVLSLITAHVRFLLWEGLFCRSAKGMGGFLKSKIRREVKHFSIRELIDGFRFCAVADFEIKSGLLEPDLALFRLIGKIC